jgi:hypothetical protein
MLSDAADSRINQLLPPLRFRADLAALATGIRQNVCHCA